MTKRNPNYLDPDVADEVGHVAALIYSFIRYFCEAKKSENNDYCFKEGRYWVFNSVSGFRNIFTYLSEKQIRVALQKLLDANYITSGEFNKDNRDRTKWYSDLRCAICPEGQMHLPSKSTPTLAPEGKPLHIDKHKNLKNKTKSKIDDVLQELITVLDLEIAEAVILHRKAIRKKLTPLAAKMLATAFAKTPNPNHSASLMVMNGWQGFNESWVLEGNGKFKKDFIETSSKETDLATRLEYLEVVGKWKDEWGPRPDVEITLEFSQ